MFSRLFTGCLVALLLIAGSWLPARATTRHADLPYLVLIVMDGYRADYQTLAPMKHLRALMARGMSYDTAWVGQMESETPTGHATIGTGIYPRKHGVVGFGWRDPASGGFVYPPTDLRQIAAGTISRLVEGGGVPTISDLVHTYDHTYRSVSVSGEKYYAAATVGVGADYILYGHVVKTYQGHTEVDKFRAASVTANVPPARTHFSDVTVGDGSFNTQDEFATTLALQMVRTVHPRVLLVNLPATDEAGHYYGGMADRPDMTPILKGADWAIGRIVRAYARLGLLKRTLFVVTADHGMAASRHIVPIHPMYAAVAKMTSIPTLDQEYRISVGSIWLRDPQQSKTMAATMAAGHFSGVEGALYKVSTSTGSRFVADPGIASSLPHNVLHAYLDLANTEAGPTGPDVVMPYGEDTLGLVAKGTKYWGSHGGFSWGVQHIPLVLAGPGVKHGVSHFPAKLVDIAPTIEQLLGLQIPSGVDGVVLADSLTHAAPTQQTAQRGVLNGRLTDVKALEAHSAAQSHKHG